MERRIFFGRCAAAVLALRHAASPPVASAAESPTPRAAARWPYEWRSGDFIVHADFDVRSRGGMIEDLQRLRSELKTALDIEIASETIHLILFATPAAYRGYVRKHFPEIPDRRALYIKRRGPGMIFAYDSRDMAVDLRHETTHAMLNASLPYMPLWLDEGLAEYFEVADEERAARNSHMKLVRLRAMLGQVPDIAAMENFGNLSAMGSGEYRDAWSWIHFLLHESQASREVLVGFLQDLQAQSPPGPLSRRLAAQIPDYRARYLAHFRTNF